MEVPIYIDDVEEGKLSITRQGNLTVFEADLRDVGRVVRLKVFGAGAEGYLGVPAPAGGRQKLVKRMSPANMRDFPKNPTYAAEKPREHKPEQPLEQQPEVGTEKHHVLWYGGKPYYF